jgi:hypothetical protein
VALGFEPFRPRRGGTEQPRVPLRFTLGKHNYRGPALKGRHKWSTIKTNCAALSGLFLFFPQSRGSGRCTASALGCSVPPLRGYPLPHQQSRWISPAGLGLLFVLISVHPRNLCSPRPMHLISPIYNRTLRSSCSEISHIPFADIQLQAALLYKFAD